MKPRAFAYDRPERLEEALALLDGDDAAVLAGGQSLVPMMNARLATPERLVDINRIASLDGIALEDDALVIGALVRHQDMAESPLVRERLPLLARMGATIAHLPIRARGTVGGSLVHADPAAQWPLAAVLLGAELVLASRRGERTVTGRAFFQGALTTAREPDEILTRIRVPLPPAGHGFGFRLLARRPGDYAVAMVAALALPGVEGGESLRVAIGGAEPVPRLCPLPVGGSAGRAADAASLAADVCAGIEPMDDPRAPADYRRRVLPWLVAGCLEDALEGTSR